MIWPIIDAGGKTHLMFVSLWPHSGECGLLFSTNSYELGGRLERCPVMERRWPLGEEELISILGNNLQLSGCFSVLYNLLCFLHSSQKEFVFHCNNFAVHLSLCNYHCETCSKKVPLSS